MGEIPPVPTALKEGAEAERLLERSLGGGVGRDGGVTVAAAGVASS